ncbi:TolC family protein [Hymenobacter metallicola]|uniref:TolC family protein n=1 Tax=Hymenobacter metallicola TaxID=2563114 RepID=A0A4Z0QF62_9BACT|nr:TolC family protein [Hymenobacter metallicola]TGE28660.1 hypothetical protein E5K02_04115 [Hymenobacter metallicola]
MKQAVALLLLLLLAGRPAPAQSVLAPAAPTLVAAEFFAAPELVLPRLYEAAISHSAEVAQLEASREIASQDLKLTRQKPLNMLALSSSYNYGTLPYFAASDGTAQVYQFNPFSQGARAQYSAGLSVVAPLDVLFGRRTTVHRQELVLSRAQAERQQKESEIRQVVIVRYQELALARTALQHYQDALQSASVSRKIADRRFKDGEIQVDEQMAAMDFYGKALLAQEEAKSKYRTAQLLLEELIGMPITMLMLRK